MSRRRRQEEEKDLEEQELNVRGGEEQERMERSRRRKRTRMILNEDNVEENLARSCNFIKVCLILRIRELILNFITQTF